MEFGPPGVPSSAKYTQSVRRKFLTASQTADFPLDGTLVGRVTALDTNSLSFTLTDLAGRNIPASYSDQALTPDLLDVFNMQTAAPVIRLECAQSIASDQTVRSIEDVHSLEVFLAAEGVPGRERLLELLRLEHGWLDGEGEPPDLMALEQARELLREADQKGLPEPGVFPLLDGAVQVQWITESDVWTARVERDARILVDYLAVEMDQAEDLQVLTAQEAVAFFARRRDNSGAK